MTKLFDRTANSAWLFLSPALAIYVVFAIWPMIDVTLMSFQRWNGLDAERPFVGLANYRHILLNDPVFWTAFGNTLFWTVLSMVFLPLIGLLLALGLNQPLWGRSGMRVVFYLPVIIAPIAVATMWRWMYDPFFGLFSQVFTELAWSVPDFLGDRSIALYSVFVAHVWQNVGFTMVLFLLACKALTKLCSRPLRSMEQDAGTAFGTSSSRL